MTQFSEEFRNARCHINLPLILLTDGSAADSYPLAA